ncbi:hypothetical protein [Vibrio sp. WXL210]|uniref:hypothetical protein n=1 Tax=Vibrio sp. WXL210 TaxID=3450709 RepID=UPI003EC8832C
MELKQLYKRLLNSVKDLELRQQKLTNALLDNQSLDVVPKLYLRGQFIEFDAEQQCLEIKIDGERYYYPLSDYCCQWLPFPDHQVLIFCSEQGRQIFGFAEGGRQIPVATAKRLALIRINSVYRTWTFRDSEGVLVELPLMPQPSEIVIGQTYRFREVESEPDRYWTLELEKELTSDRSEITNSVFNLIGSK